MSTVIVTGGRDYSDWLMVSNTLDALKIDLLVEGGATGADRLAREWAQENGVPFKTVKADWDQFGKSAGPKRNRQMLIDHPDAMVVAFPGGKGTENCVKTAVALNRIVLMVHK